MTFANNIVLLTLPPNTGIKVKLLFLKRHKPRGKQTMSVTRISQQLIVSRKSVMCHMLDRDGSYRVVTDMINFVSHNFFMVLNLEVMPKTHPLEYNLVTVQ